MGATRTEQAWLDEARALVMAGRVPTALATLERALGAYPESIDLRRAQAGILRQTGCTVEAEAQFRWLLERDAGDPASAFPLARLLNDQGRAAAAASVIRACLADVRHHRDTDLAIRAIELLDDCARKRDAADVAEAAIAANPGDARLHAYAGMLTIQLGEFDHARQHYLYALEHAAGAWEWHVPLGLASAQRYRGSTHADFALFREGLQRDGLSDKARAELHFALGKAHDDVGEYGIAAQHFREGNAALHHLTRWSRKSWRRALDARLAARPLTYAAIPVAGFTPIFIVGMPRSGTTLLAELLARYPSVCNRGELPWIGNLAVQPALAGHPTARELKRATTTYVAHARRDDAGGARWFIDKQPLNFRYVDLMLAMFPGVRVIHCERDAGDTALSLWMQCFLEDVHGYAYDFEDIQLVTRDCRKLMAHWRQRFPDAIRVVSYESLVSNPDAAVGGLAAWIGLPPGQTPYQVTPRVAAISTASLWQARQPVTTQSIGRARHYLAYIPELARFS